MRAGVSGPAEDVLDPIVGAHGGGPVAPLEDDVAEGEKAPAFETYVAPPPLRPPTDEPPAAEPPPVPPAPAPPMPEPAAAAPAVLTPAPVPAVPAADEGGATVMPEALKGAPEPRARSRREPREPREPRERRSKAFPIALGGALVLAVVAGIALGGSGGGGGEGEPSAVPVTPAAAGAVQLKLPERYAEMSSAPALPGLDLTEGAAYAPGGKDGGRAVTFGQADANDSTLLPEQFRKALGLAAGEVPERTAVKLGPDGLQAYRYEGLAPAGSSRRVTVYASPTSEGVATVACLAPPADAAAFKGECEGIADTLQIASGKPFPVGPDPAYAKTLSATLGKLDGQVARGRKALARDKTTFKAQSAAARDIQNAYVAAAKRLRETVTSPADTLINTALADRLGAAAGAWKKAASAAAKKHKRAFARSAAAIKRTQADLRRALARPGGGGLQARQTSAGGCEERHGRRPPGMRALHPGKPVDSAPRAREGGTSNAASSAPHRRRCRDRRVRRRVRHRRGGRGRGVQGRIGGREAGRGDRDRRRQRHGRSVGRRRAPGAAGAQEEEAQAAGVLGHDDDHDDGADDHDDGADDHHHGAEPTTTRAAADHLVATLDRRAAAVRSPPAAAKTELERQRSSRRASASRSW